jgi:hypothetical protein
MAGVRMSAACMQARRFTHPDMRGHEATSEVVCALELLCTKLRGGQTDEHVGLDAIATGIALLHIPACDTNLTALAAWHDSMLVSCKSQSKRGSCQQLLRSHTRGYVDADDWWRLRCWLDHIQQLVQRRSWRPLHHTCQIAQLHSAGTNIDACAASGCNRAGNGSDSSRAATKANVTDSTCWGGTAP